VGVTAFMVRAAKNKKNQREREREASHNINSVAFYSAPRNLLFHVSLNNVLIKKNKTTTTNFYF
jgi:hypothetical protein